jgi:hypothetical protein
MDKNQFAPSNSNQLFAMKIRPSLLLNLVRAKFFLTFGLELFVLVATGCSTFLQIRGFKNYPIEIERTENYATATPYQKDFLHLKTLGEEVFPLQDRYFHPEKRAAMEDEILAKLDDSDCTHETFIFSIRRYLAAFNNQHARVHLNPKPVTITGLYPFKARYLSNDLYISDIIREYDRSLVGQKITAINGRRVAEVEQKFFSLVNAENPWTQRTSLHAPPFPLIRPNLYHILGLSSSSSNNLTLEFAAHPPVSIAPRWTGDLQWHNPAPPPHPITARSSHLYDCQIFPAQNLAYLQFNACFDKTTILEGLDFYVKPWMRPFARAYIAFQLARKNPSRQFRSVYDPDRPVFKDYLASALREIQQHGITNLIVDLRYNAGGQTELCKQLLYHLTPREDLRDARGFLYNLEAYSHYDPKAAQELRSRYREKFGTEPPQNQLLPIPANDRPFFDTITDPSSPYHVTPDRPIFTGKIIVLANQNTESAASLLAGLMQDNQLAQIVGTTTANNPTGPTGFTPFKLPHSQMIISLPTEYYERALPSNGDILQPDHWIEPSLSDLHTGRDAAFEKATGFFQSQ